MTNNTFKDTCNNTLQHAKDKQMKQHNRNINTAVLEQKDTTTTTTTTITIISGGRPASTSVVSPYSGPVTTGKPGIYLAPSSFRFSQSPLPALCRQATSCAWRSRLRLIPDGRFGCKPGRTEVRSRGHPWATSAARMGARRNHSGVFGRPWATLAAQVAKDAV